MSKPMETSDDGANGRLAPPDAYDPRVFFAAERTLLAWLRTGIAVMGIGFLVARFGLFLRMMRQPQVVDHVTASRYLGVGFVLLGAVGIALASWQFANFVQSLAPKERPPRYSVRLGLWYALLIAALGLGLAGYLMLTP